jgi:hypothetical protein
LSTQKAGGPPTFDGDNIVINKEREMTFNELITEGKCSDSQRKACELLGISADEWWFTCGRYIEARKELAKLRVGVARVAQKLGIAGVYGNADSGYADIHARASLGNHERGWNAICASICDEIEKHLADMSEIKTRVSNIMRVMREAGIDLNDAPRIPLPE